MKRTLIIYSALLLMNIACVSRKKYSEIERQVMLKERQLEKLTKQLSDESGRNRVLQDSLKIPFGE